MKPIARRTSLNPAFKRFQRLPSLVIGSSQKSREAATRQDITMGEAQEISNVWAKRVTPNVNCREDEFRATAGSTFQWAA